MKAITSLVSYVLDDDNVLIRDTANGLEDAVNRKWCLVIDSNKGEEIPMINMQVK